MNEPQVRKMMERIASASSGTIPETRISVEHLRRTNLGWGHDGDGRVVGGPGSRNPTTHSLKIGGFGWSLLVTDDNQVSRQVVAILCEFLGYAIRGAENIDFPMSEADIQAGADAYRRAKARD